LKDTKKIEKILRRVRDAIRIPLMIKIRTGWDSSCLNYTEILKIAESCGVNALAIHARTKAQGFSGRADWFAIKRAKEAAKIPVIGNGDVRSPEDVKRMISQTGCDGVMIGRAAMGNPWIFSQSLSFINSGVYTLPCMDEVKSVALEHLGMTIDRYGHKNGPLIFRKRLSWYVRGKKDAASFRVRVNRAATFGELSDLIKRFFSQDTGIRDRCRTEKYATSVESVDNIVA